MKRGKWDNCNSIINKYIFLKTISKKKTYQNCQKIEVYGSPTTKDLKKPHSSRWVRGAESQTCAEKHGDMVWQEEVVMVAVKQAAHDHIWWIRIRIPWE